MRNYLLSVLLILSLSAEAQTQTNKTSARPSFSGPVDIRSDHLVVLQKKHQAIFSGNVKCVQGDLVITCDKLKVLYFSGEDQKSEAGEIRNMIFSGSVSIDQKTRRGYCEKAEYDRLFESYGISFFDHINVMYNDDLVFHRAQGCPECDDSGYLGRTGLYELLVVNQNIRQLIMKRASLTELIEEAMSDDMTLLSQEGIQLVFEGVTDCKELMSVCTL